jgi:CMP-N-acetylneuraminic acid synthetase
MKVVAFIPLKLNNERLPGKNTKQLGNQPLLSYIVNTALHIPQLDEIYVYCSDDEIKQYLPSRIKFLKRDTNLDTSSATGNDILEGFVRDVRADVYVQLHATAPFTKVSSVEGAIHAVISGEYDCAFPVTRNVEFVWTNSGSNYNTQDIPRTQELEPFYVETTGFYVYTRNVALSLRSRIGHLPKLIEVSKIEAVDINEPIDFEIANALLAANLVPICYPLRLKPIRNN